VREFTVYTDGERFVPYCECGHSDLTVVSATSNHESTDRFADLGGNYHIHEDATTKVEYECKFCKSRFMVTIKSRCWCGWPVDGLEKPKQ